jgi:hypothetical protein
MPKNVKVVIKKNGEMEYTVSGVKGKGCKDLTRFLDQMGQVLETENTAEYCMVPEREDDRIKN